MRRIVLVLTLLNLSLLSACAKGKYASNKLADKNNKVANVVNEQIKKEESKVNTNNSKVDETKESISKTKESISETKESNATGSSNKGNEPTDKAKDTGVDYDLTTMNSDMVYASVYQLMVDPETYVGKTFKMQGTYYSTFYEPTNKYYHYVIIEDAAACCAQGLEFVWGDGSHVYPDEYPANESRVEVSGTFETYKEGEDERLYCRIVNATMRPLEK